MLTGLSARLARAPVPVVPFSSVAGPFLVQAKAVGVAVAAFSAAGAGAAHWGLIARAGVRARPLLALPATTRPQAGVRAGALSRSAIVAARGLNRRANQDRSAVPLVASAARALESGEVATAINRTAGRAVHGSRCWADQGFDTIPLTRRRSAAAAALCAASATLAGIIALRLVARRRRAGRVVHWCCRGTAGGIHRAASTPRAASCLRTARTATCLRTARTARTA